VVERVLREFLKCGLLEHGFDRLWCSECRSRGGFQEWRQVTSAQAAEAAINRGVPVLTDDPSVLTTCPAIDILV